MTIPTVPQFIHSPKLVQPYPRPPLKNDVPIPSSSKEDAPLTHSYTFMLSGVTITIQQ